MRASCGVALLAATAVVLAGCGGSSGTGGTGSPPAKSSAAATGSVTTSTPTAAGSTTGGSTASAVGTPAKSGVGVFKARASGFCRREDIKIARALEGASGGKQSKRTRLAIRRAENTAERRLRRLSPPPGRAAAWEALLAQRAALAHSLEQQRPGQEAGALLSRRRVQRLQLRVAARKAGVNECGALG